MILSHMYGNSKLPQNSLRNIALWREAQQLLLHTLNEIGHSAYPGIIICYRSMRNIRKLTRQFVVIGPMFIVFLTYAFFQLHTEAGAMTGTSISPSIVITNIPAFGTFGKTCFLSGYVTNVNTATNCLMVCDY